MNLVQCFVCVLHKQMKSQRDLINSDLKRKEQLFLTFQKLNQANCCFICDVFWGVFGAEVFSFMDTSYFIKWP